MGDIKLNIPERMQAVSINKQDGTLVVQNVPVPELAKGEVLVKISAAPINPSDLSRIKNSNRRDDTTSFVPGIEGSGTVVAAGAGLLPRLWLGKRVVCSSINDRSGTWAEYMVTKAERCFPLRNYISDYQGAMLLVNPMTAIAFFDIIRRGNHKAIVNTAAAGSLGKMIELLGRKFGISVVNIVRNKSQVDILHAIGAKYVLDSSNENFREDFHSLCLQLNSTLVFDAIAGRQTQQFLDVIPNGGSVIIYGNLSDEKQELNLTPLVMGNKKLSGFFLANWINENGLIKTIRSLIRVQQLFKRELKIEIQGRFPLEKVQQAVDTYLNNMSAGKVLLITGSKEVDLN